MFPIELTGTLDLGCLPPPPKASISRNWMGCRGGVPSGSIRWATTPTPPDTFSKGYRLPGYTGVSSDAVTSMQRDPWDSTEINSRLTRWVLKHAISCRLWGGRAHLLASTGSRPLGVCRVGGGSSRGTYPTQQACCSHFLLGITEAERACHCPPHGTGPTAALHTGQDPLPPSTQDRTRRPPHGTGSTATWPGFAQASLHSRGLPGQSFLALGHPPRLGFWASWPTPGSTRSPFTLDVGLYAGGTGDAALKLQERTHPENLPGGTVTPVAHRGKAETLRAELADLNRLIRLRAD